MPRSSLPRFVSLLSFVALTLAACGDNGGSTAEGGSSGSSGGEASSSTVTPTSGGEATCGDGKREGSEVCDGDDLDGKQCKDVDAAFLGGTLKCGAKCDAFDAAACELDPGAALVTLNEVTSKGATTGPFADKGDAIELYNAGGGSADLTGWKLSDDPTFPLDKTYVFPPGSELAPGAYLVLVEFDDMTMTGDLPFGISASGEETLTLTDAKDATVDQLIVQGADAAVSYCRLPDGTGAWQTCDQTLGGANAEATATCNNAKLEPGEDCDGAELGGETCAGLDLGFTGGTLACTAACTFDASLCETASTVAINELESTDDKIELYNAGGAMVDISGWILTDDVVDAAYDPNADLEKLVFPAMSTLAPKEFLIIAKGMLDGQHPFGLGGSDTVTLLQADLTVVGQVTYPEGGAAVSYCRLPDGPTGAWQADCVPTFGAANKGP